MDKELEIKKYYLPFAIKILLMSFGLYIIGFLRGISFFLDELNLARNLAELSYFELFFPLNYQQYAPPFFLQLVKVSADIFGYSELGLRFVPLLASLVSMVLFHVLVQRFFKNWLFCYPLALLVFNFYLYQQGLALKQYSVDVLLTILWVLLAVKTPYPNGRNLAGFAVLGSISVWFSMPVVFVLTGVGFYFLFQKWQREQRHFENSLLLFKNYLPILLMIATWLLSFGILFWINLRHGIQTDGLKQYHATYFLQMPTSVAHIEQSWGLIIGIFRAIVGKTAVALGWAILCFIFGVYKIWQQEKSLLLLLLLPIMICFLASLLNYYSLIIRLTLFLFPLLLLTMTFGVVFFFEKINFGNQILKRAAFGLLLFLMIFSAIHRNALPYFFKEYVRGNPRLILEKIATDENRSLPFYATHFGVSAYDFYTKYYENPIAINSKPIFYGNWNDDLTILAKQWKQQGIDRIWIFDTHTYGVAKEELNAAIEKIGVVENQFTDVFSDAFLIKLE